MTTKSPSSSAMAAALEITLDRLGAYLVDIDGWNGSHEREHAKQILLEQLGPYLRHMQIPEGQWKPIESAPKDGTEVLISTKLDVYTAYWRDEAEFYQGQIKPGWQLFSCEEDIFYSSAISPEYVTHWQPLPAPPKGEGDHESTGATTGGKP